MKSSSDLTMRLSLNIFLIILTANVPVSRSQPTVSYEIGDALDESTSLGKLGDQLTDLTARFQAMEAKMSFVDDGITRTLWNSF